MGEIMTGIRIQVSIILLVALLTGFWCPQMNQYSCQILPIYVILQELTWQFHRLVNDFGHSKKCNRVVEIMMHQAGIWTLATWMSIQELYQLSVLAPAIKPVWWSLMCLDPPKDMFCFSWTNTWWPNYCCNNDNFTVSQTTRDDNWEISNNETHNLLLMTQSRAS